jgi:hypothetical protein
MYNSYLEQRTFEILSTEETGSGLKKTLWLFLCLIFILCLVLSFATKFEKNNATFGILITINVISIIGIFIGLLYGFHKAVIINNSSNLPGYNTGSETYSPINTYSY